MKYDEFGLTKENMEKLYKLHLESANEVNTKPEKPPRHPIRFLQCIFRFRRTADRALPLVRQILEADLLHGIVIQVMTLLAQIFRHGSLLVGFKS